MNHCRCPEKGNEHQTTRLLNAPRRGGACQVRVQGEVCEAPPTLRGSVALPDVVNVSERPARGEPPPPGKHANTMLAGVQL